MPKILYIGSSGENTTSEHRRLALERTGNQTISIDLKALVSKHLRNKISSYVHYRTGYSFLQKAAGAAISAELEKSGNSFDLIWVNSGELVGTEVLKILKSTGAPAILYNNDDPFGGRDGSRFRQLRESLPDYDLAIAVRDETAADFTRLGAKRCKVVHMGYDELYHRPLEEGDPRKVEPDFESEVAFVGTWMPHEHRDSFALSLIDKGIPVSIWGNAWNRSPHWSRLKDHHRGFSIYGRDYVAAISRAKLCLGLLSKGNRDQYTTRSTEIPYAAGLLCCERTDFHEFMFEDGRDAVMWDTPEECAEVCLDLLGSDTKRENIRANGMSRLGSLQMGNEDICRKILGYL